MDYYNDTIIPYNTYQERIALACCLLLIAIVGIIGNSMVIIAVILSKTLQTKTNVFVVNLSISDLIVCCFLPWSAVALLSDDKWLIPGAEWVCQITGMTIFMSIGVSMWNLVFIAVNRLVLITKPLSTYQKIYSSWTLSIMLVISWIIPVALVGMPTFIGFGGFSFDRVTHSCSDEIKNTAQAAKYDIYQSITTAVMLTIISVSYVIIYRHVKRHFKKTRYLHARRSTTSDIQLSTHAVSSSEDTSSNSAVRDRPLITTTDEKKAREMIDITKNLFIVVCALLVFIMPFFLTEVLPLPDVLKVYGHIFSTANSAINPLIYGWRHPHFKRVLRLMLKCQYSKIPRPSKFLIKLRQ